MTSSFGRLLRHWRTTRSLTQLELALQAEVSARHLSFLETGRSRPGTEVVLRLADALGLSPRDRNGLLEAAGLPTLYPETPPDAARLAPFRRVLDLMLARHEPFPCLVLDTWWNLLDANQAARRVFGVQPPVPAETMIDLMYGPGPLREAMVNWTEVAWHGLTRLQAETRAAGMPPALVALVARVEGHLAGVPRPARGAMPEDAVVMCPDFVFGGTRVQTVSTITHFGGALDVGLDEIRIEHIFPRDPASEAFFEAMAAAEGAPPSGAR